MPSSSSRYYDQIILFLFRELIEKYGDADRLPFSKLDIERITQVLNLDVRNLPDIAYTYRSGRAPLPQEILDRGEWAIVGEGKGKYVFIRLGRSAYIDIPSDMAITKILDATPTIVLKYQRSDEQALLARIRYNRLIDIFTGLTAYHLQSHFRTTVEGLGQVEIDDLYIGVNTDGEGFLLPIEAKSTGERIGVVQVTQMVRFAREHFNGLPVRPLAVTVLEDESLMFVEFNDSGQTDQLATERYKRYKLFREIG